MKHVQALTHLKTMMRHMAYKINDLTRKTKAPHEPLIEIKPTAILKWKIETLGAFDAPKKEYEETS